VDLVVPPGALAISIVDQRCGIGSLRIIALQRNRAADDPHFRARSLGGQKILQRADMVFLGDRNPVGLPLAHAREVLGQHRQHRTIGRCRAQRAPRPREVGGHVLAGIHRIAAIFTVVMPAFPVSIVWRV
jgi:hypothetical protein